jgi:hypothetical protein
MKKLFYKLFAAIMAANLWVYYRLGGGGQRRPEIAQLLAETKQKLLH